MSTPKRPSRGNGPRRGLIPLITAMAERQRSALRAAKSELSKRLLPRPARRDQGARAFAAIKPGARA